MIKKISILLVTLSTLAFSYAGGIEISPARYEINSDKGKSVYGEFSVTNQSEVDQIYLTSAENFTAQGESGVPLFTRGDTGVASWINVEKEIPVARGEKKTITFSITVPDNADPGFHGGAISLFSKPPKNDDISVAIGTKISFLVLLKVNGDIKLGGNIKDFSVSDPNSATEKPKKLFNELPLNFSFRFANSGNDRVNPYGVITIRNSIGLKTKTLSANPNQGNVLPQSIRKFDVMWGTPGEGASSDGYFSKVIYQAKNFALGFYSAKLSIAYDLQPKKGVTETSAEMEKSIKDSSMKVVKSLYFFVFPWQLVTFSLFLFALLVLFFRRGLKRYNKWVIKQAKLSMQK